MGKRKIKDPASALSHMIGVILSIVGLVILVYKAATEGNVWHVVSFSIYGASLILLYSASTLYHAIFGSEKVNRVLRKIDHSMIYVLIAGTYTPLCLVALHGAWGWSIFGTVWGITVIGIVLKAVWIDAPRWLSTLVYVLMGWIVVIPIVPLVRSITLPGLAWLGIGGLFYSIGAIIYGTKWPKIKSKVFGFHELFHLFVLGGSISHFWLMARFVLPIS